MGKWQRGRGKEEGPKPLESRSRAWHWQPIPTWAHGRGQGIGPLQEELPSGGGSQDKISHVSLSNFAVPTDVWSWNLLPLMNKNLGDFSNKVTREAA